MIYFFYIILGLLPGIAWLLFYLRQDVHPESNKMILKVFFWGMSISALILGFELLWGYLIKGTFIFRGAFLFFIVPAFIEEYLKYFVVKTKILDNPEFDEPIDAMLYLIIAALGFATIENVLFIASPVFASILPLNVSISLLTPLKTLEIAGLRFAGATLLHALASGIVGYMLALVCFHAKREKNYPLFKYCDPAKRRKFLFTGLAIATILHASFNYFIINLGKPNSVIYIVLILGFMAFAVSLGFAKLRKLSI